MKTNDYKITIASLATLTPASILLISICATNQPQFVLDPVGPPPGMSSSGNSQGSLVVFSAFDPTGISGMDRQAHTRYEILSVNGKLLQKVRNDPGDMVGGPTSVQLAAGSYHALPALTDTTGQ
jgi:hypothetical protein